MNQSWRIWWPKAKVVMGLAIIACVGWQFSQILREESFSWSELQFNVPYVIGAGICYWLGLGCSALYWQGVLLRLGQRPSLGTTIRAYYIGQLGRYVPGKAVGVIMRARLMVGPDVRFGTAALTVVYEALVTMTAGALIAAAFFIWQNLERGNALWKAIVLLALFGIPVMPGVFDRIVGFLTARFRENPREPIESPGWRTLIAGLGLTGCGWLIQGVGLWLVARALLPSIWPWSWETWEKLTAYQALANVAGFLVIFVPYGMGVRELTIQPFLALELSAHLGETGAAQWSVVIVVLWRLVHLCCDVLAAAAAWICSAR